MARRKVQFEQGGYYHLLNRGVNRRDIFLCEDNYQFLLRLLQEASRQCQVVLVAYCLMPNHYHLVVRQDGGCTVSRLVQMAFNSYTKAFNVMYERGGTLFEGPFRARKVGRDEYLLNLCRYVHRNPLDAGLVTDPADWPYSDFGRWAGERQGHLGDPQFVREHFPRSGDYRRFVLEYVPPRWLERATAELWLE